MPLSAAQKDVIALTIDHLLDFSTEHELLMEQIAVLRATILPNFTRIIPNNAFSQLIACLINPQRYFQRLETLGSHPITIAEVQAYILRLIVKNIYVAAKHANVSSNEALSLYSAYQAIPVINRNQIFISTKASFDTGENPNQLTVNPEQIYTGTLYFEEANDKVDELVITQLACIDVEIEIGEIEFLQTSLVIDVVPNLENDEEEDVYMSSLRRYAQYMAEKIAASCAIRFLSTRFNLSTEAKLVALNRSYLLIIQKFYFDLLVNNKLDFQFLTLLSENEVENLLDKMVIRLLKNEWCDINFASRLYEPQRKVLGIYYTLIKKNLYLIECLNQLSAARCQFLIQPPIVKLIMQERLSFEEANSLPKFLQPLLVNEQYNHFFMHHTIDWDALSRITPRQCELLLTPLFTELLLLGKVDINQIGGLPIDMLQMTGEYLYLKEWLTRGSIKDNFFATMPCLYISAYSARLYAVSQGKPFVIRNEPDTADIIRNELYYIPSDGITAPPPPLQEVLWELLAMLKLDLLNLRTTASDTNNRALIKKLLVPLQCILLPRQREPDCQIVFAQLLDTVSNVREQLAIQRYTQSKPIPSAGNLVFFGTMATTKEGNDLQQFCANTLRFTAFLETIAAIKENGVANKRM